MSLHPYLAIRAVAVGCILATGLFALTACAPQQGAHGRFDAASTELAKASEQRANAAQSAGVGKALLPPLAVEMPKVDGKAIEPRFDLVVNNAPATQVFMAVVTGTRYSMVVHPSIKDNVSVNLKDVTVLEALDTIRELYGYEYKVMGTRILIQPLTLQTRVFQVNYLHSLRKGTSDVHVTSGSVSDSSGSTSGAPTATSTAAAPAGAAARETSHVTTTSNNDFWADLVSTLKAIVGNEPGRNVVVNSQSGVVVVRAMPVELRGVDAFLSTMQNVVERQVMLEAKIIEVNLSNGHQTGVNWAAFRTRDNSRFAGGVLAPGTTLTPSGLLSTPTARNADGTVNTGSLLSSDPASPGNLLSASSAPGTLFGLAFQTSNFATLFNFLETQGALQVLSSPRIATLNNQKAVLKVGTDEFFVTSVTSNTTTSGTSTTQSPTITVSPFFSGIALDVTPQIDENNQIILHVHPSVSTVVEKTKTLDLGTAGNFRLPLASSSISESDAIVRVTDGNIVAIGGLMKQSNTDDRSQVPGLGDVPVVGNLFKNTARTTTKSELVILIKPTVILGDSSWKQDITNARERIDAYERGDERGAAAPAAR
jgi:MSHA biogenesis protein MshL